MENKNKNNGVEIIRELNNSTDNRIVRFAAGVTLVPICVGYGVLGAVKDVTSNVVAGVGSSVICLAASCLSKDTVNKIIDFIEDEENLED